MTTDQRGQLACLKFEEAGLKAGYILSKPTTPSRYDYVADVRGKLFKVQVKYGDGSLKQAKGSVVVGLKRHGKLYYRDEVDVLVVYIPKSGEVLWIPIEVFEGKHMLAIRIEGTRNGQIKKCWFAKDFTLK